MCRCAKSAPQAFELVCPSEAGPDADIILRNVIAEYIEEETAKAERDEVGVTTRDFTERKQLTS